jgi:hypothetical protein
MSIEVITMVAISSSVRILAELIALIRRFKERRRRKSKKAGIEEKELEIVVINFSGRPLTKQAVNEIKKWGKCKIITKPSYIADLTNPVTYMENILNFCSNTIKELIKKDKILNNLLLGRYIIIPPGLTSITMVFTTMLHGITGHFPNTAFFYQKGMIFSLIKPFDFQVLRNKYLSIEKSSTGVEKEFVLINLSGRLLTQEAKKEIISWGKCNIIEKNIPNVDLTDPDTYMENIIDFCDKIVKELMEDDQINQNLLVGKYFIIPPGKTSIAIALIAILHGITGRFPIMSFSYMGDITFKIIKPFNFQDLRLQFQNI